MNTWSLINRIDANMVYIHPPVTVPYHPSQFESVLMANNLPSASPRSNIEFGFRNKK